MFKQGVSKATSRDLAILGDAGILHQFHLAGGTAAALRLGHRLSFDLDFFTLRSFSQTELEKSLKKIGKFSPQQTTRDTLLGIFGKTKISFFRYDYPLIGKIDVFSKIKIVSLADISAMKIDAISRRGTKRDFIDLYFICKKKPLNWALDKYRKKYGHRDVNFFHAIKSLNYFDDAEADDLPPMLLPCDWKAVRAFFLTEAPKILQAYL